MGRWLIILAEIGALILLLRMPVIQSWLGDTQDTLSQWLHIVEEWPEQRKLARFNNEIAPWYQTLRPYQQSYLADVLKNRDSVNRFYQRFCAQPEQNPYINGATLTYFCQQLSHTGLLSKPTH